MKKYSLSIFLMFILFIIPANATQVNITSSGDTYINNGGCCNVNYGSLTSLNVGHDTGALLVGLIKFDLSSIPAGVIVNSATLYLYEHTGGNVGYVQSIYNVTSSWNESTVKWSSRPLFDSTPFTSSNGITSEGWMNWNTKSTVQAWVDGRLSNNGFLLNETLQADLGLTYWTKEYSDVNYRPYLSIDYTLAPVLPPEVLLWDANIDNIIEKNEAINAVVAYFAGDIDKAITIKVILAYFG